MSKPTNEYSLPKLGIDPYTELIATSFDETKVKAAKTGLLLLWLSDALLDAMDIELAPFDITESKFDLLILLTLHGERQATPSAIAERLGIARASATAMIDWLEKRNLVTRHHSTEDRRKVFVRLTNEGHNFVQKVLPTYSSVCAASVAELSEEERAIFEKIITKLTISMQDKLNIGR